MSLFNAHPAGDTPRVRSPGTGSIIRLRFMLMLSSSIMLTGCGFHLRNQVDIPYSSIYIASIGNSPVANDLRHIMLTSGHYERLAKTPGQAERIVDIMSENSQMLIIAITGAGAVSEYQLQYRVIYRLLTPDRKEVMPPTKIMLSREMNFNSSQPYAFGDEQNFLYNDMQNDAAHQILRRLSVVH